jgi:hypothetical protein
MIAFIKILEVNMKSAKIYKYCKNKKFEIDDQVNMERPFVIEFDNEILKTAGGSIRRFKTYEDAENRLITYANEKLKELQAM